MSEPTHGLAVAYIRVSTTEQKIGPQAQEQAIHQWCLDNGVELACDPFIDLGISGGKGVEDRPGLIGALDAMRAHNAEILIAHKRDRIARDRLMIGQLELLLRRDGRRICTTDHPSSESVSMTPYLRAMEGVQDVFAELERALIRARVTESVAVKRRKGQRIGTIPYGWSLAKDDKTLVPDEREQAVVKMIKRLRSQGSSLRSIAEKLQQRGIKPRSGKRWYPTTIRNIARYDPKKGIAER